MVTHHGEFKVAVTAVCQWEAETTGWGGTAEGQAEGGHSGKTRKKEKNKGRGGEELKILENQNRWEAKKCTAHN